MQRIWALTKIWVSVKSVPGYVPKVIMTEEKIKRIELSRDFIYNARITLPSFLPNHFMVSRHSTSKFSFFSLFGHSNSLNGCILSYYFTI